MLVSVLQVQKDTMFIVLGMIVLVAAFNVVSSLIMLVKDKRADIAVLRTILVDAGGPGVERDRPIDQTRRVRIARASCRAVARCNGPLARILYDAWNGVSHVDRIAVRRCNGQFRRVHQRPSCPLAGIPPSASVVHFGGILAVCLIVLAPLQSWLQFGLLVLGCGIFGLVYCGLIWRDTVRDSKLIAAIDLEDRISGICWSR